MRSNLQLWMMIIATALLLSWSINCQNSEEYKVLQLTNTVRQSLGLPQLFWNNTLYKVAKAHSESMATKKFFAHQSPIDGSWPWDRMDRAGYEWMAVAENIAAGPYNAQGVFNSWMNSAGHKANILSPDVTEMACAGVVGDRPYWTQLFGARWFGCGNGFVDSVFGETCDDGNINSGDGCSAQCTVEPGYTCTQPTNMLSAASQCTKVAARSLISQKLKWSSNPLIKRFLSSLIDNDEDAEEELDEIGEPLVRLAAPLSVRYRKAPVQSRGVSQDLLRYLEQEENDDLEDEEEDDEEDTEEELLQILKRFRESSKKQKNSNRRFSGLFR